MFGRVTPQQKRAMVGALQSQGHVVAMTGDGVNDALALKDADIGVAMGSGAAATRAVAQLVLLDGKFATMPGVVAEGRRVIANIERSANLFVTKTVYAVAARGRRSCSTGWPYPFLPRHLTIVSTFTIGIPGFFLALAPNTRRYVPGFLERVLRFCIPAGLVAGRRVARHVLVVAVRGGPLAARGAHDRDARAGRGRALGARAPRPAVQLVEGAARRRRWPVRRADPRRSRRSATSTRSSSPMRACRRGRAHRGRPRSSLLEIGWRASRHRSPPRTGRHARLT